MQIFLTLWKMMMAYNTRDRRGTDEGGGDEERTIHGYMRSMFAEIDIYGNAKYGREECAESQEGELHEEQVPLSEKGQEEKGDDHGNKLYEKHRLRTILSLF